MMTPAYEEDYLNDAAANLGDMMDFAVNCCGFDPDAFFMLFINSGIAAKFERGDPLYVAGMSGSELALEAFRLVSGQRPEIDAVLEAERTPEYWAGWIMAYCQWYIGCRFKDMQESGMTMGRILEIYGSGGADIGRYVEETRRLLRRNPEETETNLKKIRRARGYSQSELAFASGVALRMIQLYEQRQNDINKAQVATVSDLAKALGCTAEDLLEPVV